MMISLYNLRLSLKNIENNLRHYEKETNKLIRGLIKNQKGSKTKKNGEEKKDRLPSGFNKKTSVRNELLDFFKLPEVAEVINMIISEEEENEDSKFEYLDSENKINRPSVTKIINRYIKERGLQTPYNKQFFIPDERLKKILLPLETTDKKNGGYRCFNLQKYIKHMFIT
jgi:chromatin remodeling complex protein RSC6